MSDVRFRPPWPGDFVNRVNWLAHNAYQRKKLGLQRVCRLCARPGLPDNRYTWHPRCAAIIKPAIFPSSAIRWLLRRQRGTCATCDTPLGTLDKDGRWTQYVWKEDGHWSGDFYPALEVDHKVPLWKVAEMPRERRTIRWWLPGNLQGLCVPCHRAKTKREAAERAACRRPQKELFIGALK